MTSLRSDLLATLDLDTGLDFTGDFMRDAGKLLAWGGPDFVGKSAGTRLSLEHTNVHSLLLNGSV